MASAPPEALAWSRLAAYGALRMPLALVELPLYVLLPAFYRQQTGLDIGVIGAVLFATRLLDAIADPMLGVVIDRSRARWPYSRWIRTAIVPLCLGFAALMVPPAQQSLTFTLVWLTLGSVATYLAYSSVSIAYQAWGAELSTVPADRARITATREGFGLLGVLCAAALLVPERALALLAAFVGLALVAVALLPSSGPAAAPVDDRGAQPGASPVQAPADGGAFAAMRRDWTHALGNRAFRWLLGAFALNGIATAIPATLVLFFIADVLGAADSAPMMLVAYFLAGALGMPFWARMARRIGLRNTWLIGIAAAVIGFVWALTLEAGDVMPFLVVCVVTGLALGSDLAIPPAMLAKVIAEAGDANRREGTYFGIWNLVTKLNLALAAGLGLPLLALAGYEPGTQGHQPLALTLVYAALPCVLKLLAAWVLLLGPFGASMTDADGAQAR